MIGRCDKTKYRKWPSFSREALILVAVVVLLPGCTDSRTTLFSKLDEDETGIHFENTLFETERFNILNYSYFYNGGGVAIGDINNDGLQDVLFTGNMVRNRLYLNKGDFQFADITTQSGVAEAQGWCTGASMVDINYDGNLDIYICRSADISSGRRKNLLFINNGDLTFTEKAEAFGLADTGYSTQSSFFDYDKDGDLDCFIINHSLQLYGAATTITANLRGQRDPNFSCRLYRNDNGRYVDVSAEAGIISNVLTAALGLGVSDLNGDGWPDVYVSNDFNEPDYLFINNADGTFREELSQRMDLVSLYSMGTDVADFNNDGWTDVVTVDMLAEGNKGQKMHNGSENFDKFQRLFNNGFFYQYSRNMLQKNNGDGTFSEIGQMMGLEATDWSWAPLFADFDNDGYKDLFVTNGYVRDYTNMDFVMYSVDRVLKERKGEKIDKLEEYIEKMPPDPVPNYMFRNRRGQSFTKCSDDWGLGEKTLSSGGAYVDLDNDGDLDLVVNNVNSVAGVYRNNSEAISENKYLKIKLRSRSRNNGAIGARVTLYCAGDTYYQEAFVSRGFQSSVDPILNFGLGSHDVIDSIHVVWPDGKTQILYRQQVNRLLALSDSAVSETSGKIPHHDTGEEIFSVEPLHQMRHVENDFNDFNVQRLLTDYLSRQGPCVSTGDVNHDGIADLFLGGAKDQAGQLFLGSAGGKFIPAQQPAFRSDSKSEDTASEFFDADNDGDLDLYVVSGGYAFAENDPDLLDRLYVNDGKGTFVRKERALPDAAVSGSCVTAADLDNDGDIDVFVGGRAVPAKYPVAAKSRILRNDGNGMFNDVTCTVAPALSSPGMVTDARWVNINNDSFPDLIVVGEWMPVKVFINNRGALADSSASYIPFPSTGWWNAVHVDDLDNDGDADVVLGNAGLNSQIRATPQEPVTLHCQDFDENGSLDPILCYYKDGVSFPAVFRDDLIRQIPGLKKQLRSYADYAGATLGDLFPETKLKGAMVLKAEFMETIVLENTSGKGFRMHVLPAEAQYAPVYAITSLDADGDGNKDLLLAGNNSWTRIKYGRNTASHGVLLSGQGNGDFKYVPQYKSGLRLRGDVRSLTKVAGQKGETRIIAGMNDAPAINIKFNKQNNLPLFGSAVKVK